MPLSDYAPPYWNPATAPKTSGRQRYFEWRSRMAAMPRFGAPPENQSPQGSLGYFLGIPERPLPRSPIGRPQQPQSSVSASGQGSVNAASPSYSQGSTPATPLAPPANPLAALNASNQRANSTPMAFSPPANVAPGRNSLVTQAGPVEQYEFQHPNPFHAFDRPSAPPMPAARDANAGLRDLNDRLRALNQANEARNRSGGLSPYVPTGDTPAGDYAVGLMSGMRLPDDYRAEEIQRTIGHQPRTTVGGRFGAPAGISPYTESQIPRDVAISRLGNQRESSLYDISHPGQTPYAPKPLKEGPSYAGTFTNRNRYTTTDQGALTPKTDYLNELTGRREAESQVLAANRQAYLDRRGQVAEDRQDSIRNGTIITPAQRRLATRNAQAQTDFERALGAKNPMFYASITNNRNDNMTRSKIDDSETTRQTGRNQTNRDVATTQADAAKYSADKSFAGVEAREKGAGERTDKTTAAQIRISEENRQAEEARIKRREQEFKDKLAAEARINGIDLETGQPIKPPPSAADLGELPDALANQPDFVKQKAMEKLTPEQRAEVEMEIRKRETSWLNRPVGVPFGPGKAPITRGDVIRGAYDQIVRRPLGSFTGALAPTSQSIDRYPRRPISSR